ncbi:hypothetical protein Vafri_9055 [Volvox africanus]|uniref:CCHC-type domain-containing protein n=1 Tax=Volvox africanus TaxID=51714 RepID=A0A8J4EZD6_9CHLO|nr:hypothetical protein Vafri_9055 [Volvox africanus]
MDNTKKRHADPKLLGKLNDPTDPGTILGAAVDSFVRQTQTPAEAQFATLIFQCRNLPNMAKQELEAFLREWCRKHSIASQIGAHNQQQGQQQQGQQQQGQQQQGQQQQGQQQQGQQQQGQQQQGQQQQGQQQQGQQQQGQQQRQERQQVYQGLQHEGHQRGDTATGPHDAFRTAGRCNPANSRPLWSGSLSLSWSLYPKIPSVGLMVTCSVERQQWSSREAAASWRWMNRLWAHEVAVPRSGQGNAATVSDDSDPVPGGVDPWQSGSGIEACEAGGIGVGAVEKDASSGESGGSARKEERDSTPGCGIISGVNAGDNHGGGREHVREDGDAASIGCAQSDGDTARGGNDGHGVTLDSDTTMQRSPLNFEDAIAFNLAYEKENNTPPYNRLPVLPLRLGSGLAASALPCGPLTHSSAGWQLLGAVSTAAMNHGWRPGPGDGKVHLRPLKRQRMDNDGGNTLGQNFAFVLDRCWNCGSYGHHLQGCIHPRNHAVVEACRRESSQLAQRTVRQAAAAQQRGPRKASYRRYVQHAATPRLVRTFRLQL